MDRFLYDRDLRHESVNPSRQKHIHIVFKAPGKLLNLLLISIFLIGFFSMTLALPLIKSSAFFLIWMLLVIIYIISVWDYVSKYKSVFYYAP